MSRNILALNLLLVLLCLILGWQTYRDTRKFQTENGSIPVPSLQEMSPKPFRSPCATARGPVQAADYRRIASQNLFWESRKARGSDGAARAK